MIQDFVKHKKIQSQSRRKKKEKRKEKKRKSPYECKIGINNWNKYFEYSNNSYLPLNLLAPQNSFCVPTLPNVK